MELKQKDKVYVHKQRRIKANIDKIYNCNMLDLRNFYVSDRYDVIYGSWALSYLDNDECVQFLEDAKYALRGNSFNRKERPGLIIIKETIR